MHHVFRLQFSDSWLRALASDAGVRSLRVAVARSEVGDGASRLQTVWRRRRAGAMRHILWSKLCEYALLSDHLCNGDVSAGAWQQRARCMRVNGPEAWHAHPIGKKHGKNLCCSARVAHCVPDSRVSLCCAFRTSLWRRDFMRSSVRRRRIV